MKKTSINAKSIILCLISSLWFIIGVVSQRNLPSGPVNSSQSCKHALTTLIIDMVLLFHWWLYILNENLPYDSFSALYSNLYFLIIPGDTDVVPGGNLYFSCKAGGDPPPRLFWRKDGVTLDLENRSSGSNKRERRLVDGSSRLHIYQVPVENE